MRSRTSHNDKGFVWLVGAGPGDPGLITVNGLAALKRAQVVIYDRLVSSALLKRVPRSARRIYVGKQPGKVVLTQEKINALLVQHARRGHRVVRLKGGDPVLFGRGSEEALALVKAHIPFEIIPGITSAIAVPTYAGIPVTHRGMASSVSIFTGHEDPMKRTQHRDWRAAARGKGTLVFLMGVKELPRLVRDVRGAGRGAHTSCALIEQGTLPEQRTTVGTLGTIVRLASEAQVTPPAIFIVGEVAKLHTQLTREAVGGLMATQSAAEPLTGKRILVTRPADRASGLAGLLEQRGADVIRLPAIQLRPLQNQQPIRTALGLLQQYDWILFTSTEGVKYFVQHVRKSRTAARALRQIKIGAIGPKTAEAVRASGVKLHCVPKAFHQEGMLAALKRYAWHGKRVLIPRAAQARMVLPDTLRDWGAIVDVVALYEAKPVPGVRQRVRRLLQTGSLDVITFTSSQCVEQFLDALHVEDARQLINGTAVASIGPITTATARDRGFRVDMEAKKATVPDLVHTITTWASG